MPHSYHMKCEHFSYIPMASIMTAVRIKHSPAGAACIPLNAIEAAPSLAAAACGRGILCISITLTIRQLMGPPEFKVLSDIFTKFSKIFVLF